MRLVQIGKREEGRVRKSRICLDEFELNLVYFWSVKDDSVIVTRKVALAHFIDIFIMTVGYPILLPALNIEELQIWDVLSVLI